MSAIHKYCMAGMVWGACGNVLAGCCWGRVLRRRLHCLRLQAQFSAQLAANSFCSHREVVKNT